METIDTEAVFKAKHSFARAFYACQLQELVIRIWNEVSGGEPIRPSSWHKLVEHPELWKATWNKFATLSSHSVSLFEGELPDDGVEAVTDDAEIYFLVPLNCARIPVGEGGVLEAVANEGPRVYACQQLLKIILTYAFAHIYQGEFTVNLKDRQLRMDHNSILRPFHKKG